MTTMHMQPIRGMALERTPQARRGTHYSPYHHLQEQQQEIKQLYYRALNNNRTAKVRLLLWYLEGSLQQSTTTLVFRAMVCRETLYERPIPGPSGLCTPGGSAVGCCSYMLYVLHAVHQT